MDRKLMLFIMMGALILCSLFHWEDLICIFSCRECDLYTVVEISVQS